MFQLQTNGVFGTTTTNYAATRNARFNDSTSSIRTIRQRWDETYNQLPTYQKRAIDYAIMAAKAEFRRRNPTFKTWNDVSSQLAKAYTVKMSNVDIDATMQRQLNIDWVISLLNTFVVTKVVPIQVYQPDALQDKYLAWDGQHTLVLLWLIATQLFEVDPEDITIPVNVYASHLKHEMRANFIDLNSEIGKKMLELIDKFEQMVYGVRVDGSTNPIWIEAERKQTIIESAGLFITAKKFGDHEEAGAISRLQEINKLSPESVNWLCLYLVAVGAQHRPVGEKEMVMMAYFFERCRLAKLKVTPDFIFDIAASTKQHWDADFTPTSKFWVRVSNAYSNWHNIHVGYGTPRCSKEPNHGYPFLVAQLKKDLPNYKFPDNRTNSEFTPNTKDLF